MSTNMPPGRLLDQAPHSHWQGCCFTAFLPLASLVITGPPPYVMPLWVFFKRMVEATHPLQVVPAIPVSWDASSPLVLPYFSPGADWCPAKPPSLVSCPGHSRVATSTQSGGPGPAAGHTTAGCAEASSSRALPTFPQPALA